ncbi:hypothetical protein QQS21_008837 [Conoideocrella luteorostrata]|uniref:Phosphatidylserine decarboxylase n=1 Tax=Conoideocrella luteorostrata TaxID=1105319 RepID=A0AAJ0CKT0_9HYPO|nr:hypothetical protein QQS21_008837 [Conoideocrella luteorostrata]
MTTPLQFPIQSNEDVPGLPFPLPDIKDVPPFINSLILLIDPSAEKGREMLQEAINKALEFQVDVQLKWKINTVDMFLRFAAGHLKWIPTEDHSGNTIYLTICLFYFILDQDPVSGMQTKIVPSEVDRPLTVISQWITMFAMRVGDFMSTEASLTPESLASFENQKDFHMEEALYPPGGFKTFNQLFCRHLKPGRRPIVGDDKTIVFPADSRYDCAAPVNNDSTVTIKQLPWSINALLRGSAYSGEFAGGTWMHSFLGPRDYHRQHAPVSGKVLEAKVIQGLCYLEVDVEKKDKSGKSILRPHRSWETPKFQLRPDEPFDEVGAPNTAGYQFIQTHGCIIIENPVVGLVAVLPVGMAYVSSVNLSVQSRYETNGPLPSYVNKGDEISNFQFGGSDIVVVFQGRKPGWQGKPGPPGVKITAKPDQHYNYGEELAIVTDDLF